MVSEWVFPSQVLWKHLRLPDHGTLVGNTELRLVRTPQRGTRLYILRTNCRLTVLTSMQGTLQLSLDANGAILTSFSFVLPNAHHS